MTMVQIIVLLCFLLRPMIALAEPIDELLVRSVDVTGDGKPEKITLVLKAKDFNSPFQWSLSISSSGKQLFTYASDDTRIDPFFADRGFITDCSGYAECKKKWYFKDILNSLIVPRSGYDLEGILDKSKSNTLYPLGRQYLKECCGIKQNDADAILSRIEKRIRNNQAVLISIPKSPVTSDALMIFCPEVDRFIPVYED